MTEKPHHHRPDLDDGGRRAPVLGVEGLSILTGVTEDELRLRSMLAEGDLDTRTWMLPEWWKAGRRRAREAMAATGSDALVNAIRYWAAREHGADVEFDYRGAQ